MRSSGRSKLQCVFVSSCVLYQLSAPPFARHVTNCLPGCSSSSTSPRRSPRHAVSFFHPLRCSRRWLASPPTTTAHPPCCNSRTTTSRSCSSTANGLLPHEQDAVHAHTYHVALHQSCVAAPHRPNWLSHMLHTHTQQQSCAAHLRE
jgi:hypothetical protein